MTDVYLCEIKIRQLTPEVILALAKWAYRQEKRDIGEFALDITLGDANVKSGSGAEKVRINISEQRLKIFSELSDLRRKWEAETPKKASQIYKEITATEAEYGKTHDCTLPNCGLFNLLEIPFSFCFSKDEFEKEPSEVQEALSEFGMGPQGNFCAGTYWVRVEPDKIEVSPMFRENILSQSEAVKAALVQLSEEIGAKRAVITHTSYDEEERAAADIVIYPRT